MSHLLSTLLLLASSAIAGDPVPDTTVQIYRADQSPKTISLETLPGVARVRSKTPHRQLNPEGKVSEFEGIDLRSLLKLSAKDRGSLIHFVGTDGYISAVPAKVLLATDAILALKEDGKALDNHRGGIQVIFPTEGKNAVEEAYAKKAAFWCWYVRSIVIGDLPNRLTRSNANLRAETQKATTFPFIPPSVFQFEKADCPKSVRIPLSKLVATKMIAANFLSGITKKLPAADFDLVFAAQEMALPVICGGPFALIERKKLKTLTPPIFAKNLETNLISVEESK